MVELAAKQIGIERIGTHDPSPLSCDAGTAALGLQGVGILERNGRRSIGLHVRPRPGRSSGKSFCTSRRWRLFFVQFQPLGGGKKSASQDETAMLTATANGHRVRHTAKLSMSL